MNRGTSKLTNTVGSSGHAIQIGQEVTSSCKTAKRRLQTSVSITTRVSHDTLVVVQSVLTRTEHIIVIRKPPNLSRYNFSSNFENWVNKTRKGIFFDMLLGSLVIYKA